MIAPASMDALAEVARALLGAHGLRRGRGDEPPSSRASPARGGDRDLPGLVKHVFEREPGRVGQELGGVAVTVLALAAAAGLSADEEECREVHRVLSKPLREFTERDASKNAAGLKIP